jgi:hypothetical protein
MLCGGRCQPRLLAIKQPLHSLRTRSARTWHHCTSGQRAHAASTAHHAASPADTSRPKRTPAAAGTARQHQFTTARKPYAVHVRAPAQPCPVQPVRDVAGVPNAHPALSPKPPATPSAVSTPCASRQAAYAPMSRDDRPEAHEGRSAAVQALRCPRGARCQPALMPLRSPCVLERTHLAHHHHGAHARTSLQCAPRQASRRLLCPGACAAAAAAARPQTRRTPLNKPDATQARARMASCTARRARDGADV